MLRSIEINAFFDASHESLADSLMVSLSDAWAHQEVHRKLDIEHDRPMLHELSKQHVHLHLSPGGEQLKGLPAVMVPCTSKH